MRTIIFLFLVFWTSLAWSQQWQQGLITRQVWLDQGGFQIEIDGTQFTFMREAKVFIDSNEYEVPDRMTHLTAKSKVRFQAKGFRIYAIELQWRY